MRDGSAVRSVIPESKRGIAGIRVLGLAVTGCSNLKQVGLPCAIGGSGDETRSSALAGTSGWIAHGLPARRQPAMPECRTRRPGVIARNYRIPQALAFLARRPSPPALEGGSAALLVVGSSAGAEAPIRRSERVQRG
jgi:hypothetical protein